MKSNASARAVLPAAQGRALRRAVRSGCCALCLAVLAQVACAVTGSTAAGRAPLRLRGGGDAAAAGPRTVRFEGAAHCHCGSAPGAETSHRPMSTLRVRGGERAPALAGMPHYLH